MTINKYNHIVSRVEYPQEFGYRMEPKQLPDWIHFTITEEGNTKFVTVCSRIHVNKKVRVGPEYSNEFTDHEIIIDVSGKITHMFL